MANGKRRGNRAWAGLTAFRRAVVSESRPENLGAGGAEPRRSGLQALDPEIRAFIAESDLDYPADAASRPVVEQRGFYDAMCARFRAPRPDGVAVTDGAIARPDSPGGVPIRSYRPLGRSTAARVVYYHGGGYLLGGLESHDDVCAELAEAAGVELVSVDYRLAPEHPFPAPFEDALAAAEAFRAEGAPLILAGDSVGASLAAGVALALAEKPGAPLRGTLLIYPSLSPGRHDLPSYVENAEAPMFTTAYAVWSARRHAGAAEPATLASDSRYAPLSAQDVSKLPPSLAFAVDLDPVRDDALAWAAKLSEAGVPAAASVHAGLPHGCLRARHRSLKARQFFDAVRSGLRQLANI